MPSSLQLLYDYDFIPVAAFHLGNAGVEKGRVGRACCGLAHQTESNLNSSCLGLAMLGVVLDNLCGTIQLILTGLSRGKHSRHPHVTVNTWTHREPEGEVWVDLGDEPRGAGAGLCAPVTPSPSA